jgi:hypothetical protein
MFGKLRPSGAVEALLDGRVQREHARLTAFAAPCRDPCAWTVADVGFS